MEKRRDKTKYSSLNIKTSSLNPYFVKKLWIDNQTKIRKFNSKIFKDTTKCWEKLELTLTNISVMVDNSLDFSKNIARWNQRIRLSRKKNVNIGRRGILALCFSLNPSLSLIYRTFIVVVIVIVIVIIVILFFLLKKLNLSRLLSAPHSLVVFFSSENLEANKKNDIE